MSWLLLAFLGGAFYIEGAEDLSSVLIFVLVAMFSLLCHELGHALAGRRWMGSVPSIVIGGLGGVTINEGIRVQTRSSFFAMVFAGPLAGFLPALLVFVLLAMSVGDWGACFSFLRLSCFSFTANEETLNQALPVLNFLFSDSGEGLSPLYDVVDSFFFVGIWWTILNLLPIFPLDGGNLLGTLLNNFKVAALVGIVFSVFFVLFCLSSGSVYNSLLAAYLAYVNWQHFQSFRRLS